MVLLSTGWTFSAVAMAVAMLVSLFGVLAIGVLIGMQVTMGVLMESEETFAIVEATWGPVTCKSGLESGLRKEALECRRAHPRMLCVSAADAYEDIVA